MKQSSKSHSSFTHQGFLQDRWSRNTSLHCTVDADSWYFETEISRDLRFECSPSKRTNRNNIIGSAPRASSVASGLPAFIRELEMSDEWKQLTGIWNTFCEDDKVLVSPEFLQTVTFMWNVRQSKKHVPAGLTDDTAARKMKRMDFGVGKFAWLPIPNNCIMGVGALGSDSGHPTKSFSHDFFQEHPSERDTGTVI